jgi:hypothetical protein
MRLVVVCSRISSGGSREYVIRNPLDWAVRTMYVKIPMVCGLSRSNRQTWLLVCGQGQAEQAHVKEHDEVKAVLGPSGKMVGLRYPDQEEMRVVSRNPACPYSRKSGSTGAVDEEHI